jgi:hypothetical protein
VVGLDTVKYGTLRSNTVPDTVHPVHISQGSGPRALGSGLRAQGSGFGFWGYDKGVIQYMVVRNKHNFVLYRIRF